MSCQYTQHKLYPRPPPPQQQQQQHPIKMVARADEEELRRVQRKLFSFLYLLALIVVLYVTCAAAFYFHQQSSNQQQQQAKQQDKQQLDQAESEPLAAARQESLEPRLELLKQELDTRFVFVERLVEALTIELQEAQRKLREREKCDCQVSCHFNGTRFADGSAWQNQCDTCTCRAGKISCLPRRCPPASCDDPVQVAGQCCPVCMKRCQYNSAVIRHGQRFTPQDTNKECKCQDGRIKCEPRKLSPAAATRSSSVLAPAAAASAANKTLKGSDQTNNKPIPVGAATPKAAESQMSPPAKGAFSGGEDSSDERRAGGGESDARSSGPPADKVELKQAAATATTDFPDQKVNIENG